MKYDARKELPGLPRRHSDLCEEHGHGRFCPRAIQRTGGRWKKGSSGNTGLRTLREIREYIGDVTNDGRMLIDIAMNFIRGQDHDGASPLDIPPAVRARVLIALIGTTWGNGGKTQVEVTGTVKHEASAAAPARDWSRLTVEEHRVVLEALRKTAVDPEGARQLAAPVEAEDAEFEETEEGDDDGEA